MSSATPEPYRLAPKARTGLNDIWRYTAENRPIDQADNYIDILTHAFETIAAMPSMARERVELIRLSAFMSIRAT